MSHRRPRSASMLAIGLASLALADDNGESRIDPAPQRVFTFGSAGFEVGLSSGLRDASGRLGVSRVGARLGATFVINPEHRLTVSVADEVSFYDFRRSDLLTDGSSPISTGNELSLAALHQTRLDEGWDLVIGASVKSSLEGGAEFGDSLTFGGFLGATHQITPRLALGGGVLVRTQLERNAFIVPIVLVDYRITDRLTLSNTRDLSGAGARLSYAIDEQWIAFLDASYERREFRLADDNPVPEGVLRDTRVPIALGVIHAPNPNLSVQVRGGVNAYQRIRVGDDDGRRIASTEVDPTGFIDLSATLRF